MTSGEVEMKFNTIRIEKVPDEETGEPVWIAYVTHDPADRVGTDQGPHSAGFYHCPETKSVSQGFEELKGKMVADCINIIHNATWNLQQLLDLQLPSEEE